MKTPLNQIATIQTGYFAKPILLGDVIYLQAKHFDEQGNLFSDLQPDLLFDGIAEKHFLQKGDVLFAAKGSKNFAAVFKPDNIPAVASTSFFVIRIHDFRLTSEYLTWFLNSSNVQSILKSQAMGTSMLSISKQVLEDLEIPLTTLEKQNSVVAIANLMLQEKSIHSKLQKLRDKLINHQIFKAINHES